MFNFDIIFVAGAHGVGKGYFCSEIEKEIGLPIFSASTLIKDVKKSAVDIGKRVIDPDQNQDYLITAISNINTPSKTIILNGHFCLYDGNKIIEVELNVFKSMPLSSIIILFDDPQVLYERLKDRDGKSLDIDIINALQNKELELGKITANQLNIPLLISSSSQSSEVLHWIVR
ncbi:MAG: AAA family ATPase [Methylococcaceae bacterium]|nr:AAA family ATPase [Methylococcaceae bacterium]